MPHNRSVLKERRIYPGALTYFAVAECRGWRLGLVGGGGSAGSVLRSQGTLGPVGLSRCARGGSGCRRSYARSGPVPLPPGAPSGINYVSKSRSLSTGWDWVPGCVLVCTRVRGDRRLRPATRTRVVTTNPGPRQGHGFRVTLSGRNPMEGVNEHGIHAGPFIGSPVATLSAMPVPQSRSGPWWSVPALSLGRGECTDGRRTRTSIVEDAEPG